MFRIFRLLDWIFSYTSEMFFGHQRLISMILGLIIAFSFGVDDSYLRNRYVMFLLGFPIYYTTRMFYWRYRERYILNLAKTCIENGNPNIMRELRATTKFLKDDNPRFALTVESLLATAGIKLNKHQ